MEGGNSLKLCSATVKTKKKNMNHSNFKEKIKKIYKLEMFTPLITLLTQIYTFV